MLRVVVTAAAALVLGYLLVVAALWALQRQLLYLPDRSVPRPLAAAVPEMTVVRLRTADGLDLAAWWRAPAPGRPTLVYLHGNGGNIGYRGGRVRPWLDADFGVLLVGYRGYGGNPGRPTEEGLAEDARAALAFVDAAGIDDADLALYGESLGTAVAVRLAAERAAAGRPVTALVLEAPMSSVTDAAAHHYPWAPVRLLLKDRFDSIARIADVGAPLLVVHGEDDRVVPVRLGRALFEAAREPKEAAWIAGAGHEDLAAFGLHAIVRDFLLRAGLCASE